MKKMLEEYRELCKSKRYNPCSHECPFWDYTDDEKYKCYNCLDLFPAMIDYMEFDWEGHLVRNRSTFITRTTDWSSQYACPCRIFGEEFVSWRIELFMVKGV